MVQQTKAIVIGASAGALEALSALLPALPANYSCPILIVVHLPPDKSSIMAELLQAKSRITVREAEDKEPIEAGTAYFAPPDYHMLVETESMIALSNEEPVLFSRPSIDVLFESAADIFGASLTGVILTGGNDDGARGLRLIVEAGGQVLVQEPEEATAHAMPKAALAACPHARVMRLKEIATYLTEEIQP